MPTYTMHNKDTGETKDMFMSVAERDVFLSENPQWEQSLITPAFVSGSMSTLRRAGHGWKDVLGRIKGGAGEGHTIKD